jgi:hypothetical protein
MICSRCIYDDKISGINFDSDGVCSYCHQVDDLLKKFGTGTSAGNLEFEKIVSAIKTSHAKKKYDCIVGVSGGTDSSYVLYLAVKMGLRPLAVHYDNTWNSAIATQNIAIVTRKLNIDLITYVVNNQEQDEIKRALFKSGVPEFDSDTDLAFAQVLRSVAAKNGVKYILEGHSFVTEGVSPIGGNYFDGAYIKSIFKAFGRGKMKTYPMMGFWTFLKWTIIYRQKFIRPLWYLDYDKDAARKVLSTELGWQYYGGHHLENKASAFIHTVWLPQRFNVDFRNLVLAANVRRGTQSRSEALEIYSQPVVADKKLIKYVQKRLGLDESEYENLMNGPKRNWRDFKTYKRRFELLRPLFYVLTKLNLVPMSFYIKYCFPMKAD